MKKHLLVIAAALAAVMMLSSCKSAGVVKEPDYAININGTELIYGDIITYEEKIQADLRSPAGVQAAQRYVTNAALNQYPEYDFLIFPRFDFEYGGLVAYAGAGKVNVKVTGRLAKVKQ